MPITTRAVGDYLFAQPSFLAGIARILDIGGVLDDYNSARTAEEADANAMRADWGAVGSDLHDAMSTTDGDLRQ